MDGSEKMVGIKRRLQFVLLVFLFMLMAGCTTIDNDLPTAVVTGPHEICPGSAVEFSGLESYDSNGEALQYTWMVTYSPAGSQAVLTNDTSGKVSFYTDVEGVYILSLLVNDGHALSLPCHYFVNVQQGMYPLAYTITDADYTAVRDRIVLTSKNPGQLHIVNPKNGQEQRVPLLMEPLCVSVSPNGHYAAVGTVYGVEYIDLQEAVSVAYYPLSKYTSEIVSTDKGLIYFFSNKSFGVINTHTGGIEYYQDEMNLLEPYGRLSTDQTSIYLDGDLWVLKLNISSDPPFFEQGQFYQNLSSAENGFWLSPGGDMLFLNTGEVLCISNEPESPMTLIDYLDGMAEMYSAVMKENNLYVIPNRVFVGNAVACNDTIMMTYDTHTLECVHVMDLPFLQWNGDSEPGHGRYIFSDGNSLYVIMQATDRQNDNYLVVY